MATDTALKGDLERLIDPVTRGDPESPLAVDLQECPSGWPRNSRAWGMPPAVAWSPNCSTNSAIASRPTARPSRGRAIRTATLSSSTSTPKVQAALQAGEPVISVDAKKKELVGDFKNAGREWQPEGQPELVRVYDFIIPDLGRDTPYGIYDMARNSGWVNVGTDHDTAAFAVASIRRWWDSMGWANYPQAKRLLITADGGGQQRLSGATLESGTPAVGG